MRGVYYLTEKKQEATKPAAVLSSKAQQQALVEAPTSSLLRTVALNRQTRRACPAQHSHVKIWPVSNRVELNDVFPAKSMKHKDSRRRPYPKHLE